MSSLIVACSSSSDGSSSSSGSTDPAVVAVVSMTPPSLSLQVGATGTFVASAVSALGAPITGRTVTWSSAGTSIATVAAGVVTGVGAGTTLITATIDGKSAVASVTVTAAPPAQAVFSVISGGGDHTCALNAAGKAYCWGTNGVGQLGVGNIELQQHTVAVATNLLFSKISSGANHTCALTSDGTAYCWGANSNGSLGDGTNVNRLVPTPVNTQVRFASISAGANNTCGLTAAGAAYCWGPAPSIGDGLDVTRLTPVAVAGGLTFAMISPGLEHTCALTTAGKAYCWGGTANGFLGIPSGSSGVILSPNAVPGGLTFKSLGTSWAGACGVTTSDGLYCWGDMAPPYQPPATSATAVLGGPVLATLAIGTASQFGCGLNAAGAAFCWGPNTGGQLGIGTIGGTISVPTAVAGGLTFASLTTGAGFGCGLTKTGAAYCWGGSGGNQVAFGGNAAVPSPVFAAP